MTDAKDNTLPATERHPLTPFIPEGTQLLLLGSFPPPRERWCMHFFYPNFINDMWRIFGLIFYSDRDALVLREQKTFALEKIMSLLREKHIGIFDTATAVRRLEGNASDKSLEIIEPTDLQALFSTAPCLHAVAATGGKAAEEIAASIHSPVPKTGEYLPFTAGTRTLRFWRMPSSSRAYPLSLEKKAEKYRKMMEAEHLTTI